jgi:hypothetical protein
MTLRFGRTKRPTREELEQDAADVIATVVASGRPPPEVWQQAEEWRAAHPLDDDAWYKPEPPQVPVDAGGVPGAVAEGTEEVTVQVVDVSDLPSADNLRPKRSDVPAAPVSTN